MNVVIYWTFKTYTRLESLCLLPELSLQRFLVDIRLLVPDIALGGLVELSKSIFIGAKLRGGLGGCLTSDVSE